MNLTSEQLAYLSGLIDGEGSVECQKQMQRKGKTPRYVIRLSFNMVTKEPLATISKWIGLEPKFYDPPNRPANRSPQYRLHIPKTLAVQVLEDCLPYLILKRQQAKLLLAIEEVRKNNTPDRHAFTRSGSKPMPTKAVNEMEKLFRELRSLKSNKRGLQHRSA